MSPGHMSVNWLSKLDRVNTHTSERFCTGLTNTIQQKKAIRSCVLPIIRNHYAADDGNVDFRSFEKILHLKRANRHILMDLKD